MASEENECIEIIAVILNNRDLDVEARAVYVEICQLHDIDRLRCRAFLSECVRIARGLNRGRKKRTKCDPWAYGPS